MEHTIVGEWYHMGGIDGWSDTAIRRKCRDGTEREREAYIQAGYILRPERKEITDLCSLAEHVAKKHSVTADLLRSKIGKGDRRLREARAEFCYDAYVHMRVNSKIIAHFMGDRERTTILHYVKLVSPDRPKKTLTHCKNGHEYNEANTYRDRRGNRACRECRKQYQRTERSRMRKRAAYATRKARIRGRTQWEINTPTC
jgi:hypothetical protein